MKHEDEVIIRWINKLRDDSFDELDDRSTISYSLYRYSHDKLREPVRQQIFSNIIWSGTDRVMGMRLNE